MLFCLSITRLRYFTFAQTTETEMWRHVQFACIKSWEMFCLCSIIRDNKKTTLFTPMLPRKLWMPRQCQPFNRNGRWEDYTFSHDLYSGGFFGQERSVLYRTTFCMVKQRCTLKFDWNILHHHVDCCDVLVKFKICQCKQVAVALLLVLISNACMG